VARWFRWSLSVADPFVCRCLTTSAMLPFPHPAHRTGRADGSSYVIDFAAGWSFGEQQAFASVFRDAT
jgi:hypothetical protein